MTDKKSSQPQQALPQLLWHRTQTQTVAIIALIGVVAIIIGALYLAQATTTATTGSQLLELQSTRDFLQRANEDIIVQIANKKNYSTLLGRAQELGFYPAQPGDIEYLVVNSYVPNRATPTPQVTPVPTYIYDETFNGWVQQQWDQMVRQFEGWAGRDRPTPQP